MESFGQDYACGGVVGGEYMLDSVFSDFDWQGELEQACPTVSVSNVNYTGSGTLSLNSGSYARDATGTVSLSVSVPGECAAGGCGSVEAARKPEIDENFDTGDATCSDAGSGCDCDVTATATDRASGSYSTSGGVLTTDAHRTFYYCVQDETYQAREFDIGAPEAGFNSALDQVVYPRSARARCTCALPRTASNLRRSVHPPVDWARSDC
jgi:hypothetical protein